MINQISHNVGILNPGGGGLRLAGERRQRGNGVVLPGQQGSGPNIIESMIQNPMVTMAILNNFRQIADLVVKMKDMEISPQQRLQKALRAVGIRIPMAEMQIVLDFVKFLVADPSQIGVMKSLLQLGVSQQRGGRRDSNHGSFTRQTGFRKLFF